MRWTLVLIVLLLVAFPLYNVELVRYEQCRDECDKTQKSHLRLLMNPVCRNPEDRLDFQLIGTVDCERAEKESRVSVADCAYQMWWRESEVVHLYKRATDSYWKLFAWIMPLSLLSCYLWFQGRREVAVHKSQGRLFHKMAKTLSLGFRGENTKMLEGPPVHLDSKKKKRSKAAHFR